MATATLTAIRNKVRKITRSPSTNQISDADIDEYVNTFLQYDLPETLRLESMHTTIKFFTEPNIDVYPLASLTGDWLQSYTTFNPPAYANGYEMVWTQDETQFYNVYPKIVSEVQVATGDGVTTDFTGTLSSIPVLSGQVSFVTKLANNDGLVLSDNGAGALTGDTGGGANTINYVTGAYALSYSSAPASGEEIWAQTVPYQAARPQMLLYFNNEIRVRPIPDKSYPIQLEAFTLPTELLAAGNEPDLEQWWQYIAYGASRYIFQDRMDLESLNLIMPELNRQERNVLRRTIVQQTNERTATIYSDQAGNNANPNNWPGW